MPEYLPVALGERSYTIEIKAGMIACGRAAEAIAALSQGSRVQIVTHPGLLTAYAEPIRAGLGTRGISAETTVIPAGERFKTLTSVARLYSAFGKARLDRKSLIVAVGGGVLGDVVGFAAATYLRGIRFVQVPTTLLAQVDSSVGGKTGVNLPEGKNLVGAFYQPVAVLIDPHTLNSLPARELRSGLAEVIKYGIIYDEAFLTKTSSEMPLLLRRDEAALVHRISRSCTIKAEIVSQDETEQGLRAILNFGHTVGHTLETLTHYRRWKHGEAIAIGMVSACLIGEEIGLTPPDVTETVRTTLLAAGLPVDFPAEISADAVLEVAQRDKKTEGGKLRFVLAIRIGNVEIVGDIPEAAIRSALTRQIVMG